MTFNELLLLIIAMGFGVVSFALAGKFIIEAYMEYIQVKTGIRVVTDKMMEELAEQLQEEEEDER